MKNIICRFLLLCLLSVSSALAADVHQDFLDFNLRRFSYIGDIVKVKKALDLGAKIAFRVKTLQVLGKPRYQDSV